jgi:hypothetical protein
MPDAYSIEYDPVPHSTLYHYTSLAGLLEIVEEQVLWASNAHYLSDMKEIQHAEDFMVAEIIELLPRAGPYEAEILTQLRHWLTDRGLSRHQLFLCSFTEEGNLLSQWRGYTPHGLGVSLGFPAADIVKLAAVQGYRLVKCVYEAAPQRQMIGRILDAIFGRARESAALLKQDPKPMYYPVFEEFTDDLLLLSAVLKHWSFREEREWRVISPVFRDLAEPRVKYRIGRFTLIPYLEFSIGTEPGRPVQIDEVIIGPSSSLALSMDSIPQYLATHGVRPRRGVHSCGIPYRG